MPHFYTTTSPTPTQVWLVVQHHKPPFSTSNPTPLVHLHTMEQGTTDTIFIFRKMTY